MKVDSIGLPASSGYEGTTGKQVSEDTAFSDALKKAYDTNDKEKLKEVCVQFESIMLSMMYKQMKATVIKGDFIEKSSARETFEGMLDDELMATAGKRGTGLAEVLFKQMSEKMDRTYVVEEET
jgi:peptidoglycan hydrolase FlgJ